MTALLVPADEFQRARIGIRKATSLKPLPKQSGTPRPSNERGELLKTGSNRDLAALTASLKELGSTSPLRGVRPRRKRLCPLPPFNNGGQAIQGESEWQKPKLQPIQPSAKMKAMEPYVWPGRSVDKTSVSGQDSQVGASGRDGKSKQDKKFIEEIVTKEVTARTGGYVWPGKKEPNTESSETSKPAAAYGEMAYKWPGASSGGVDQLQSADLEVAQVGSPGGNLSSQNSPTNGKMSGRESVRPFSTTQMGAFTIPGDVGHPANVIVRHPATIDKNGRPIKQRSFLKHGSTARLLDPPEIEKARPTRANKSNHI